MGDSESECLASMARSVARSRGLVSEWKCRLKSMRTHVLYAGLSSVPSSGKASLFMLKLSPWLKMLRADVL